MLHYRLHNDSTFIDLEVNHCAEMMYNVLRISQFLTDLLLYDDPWLVQEGKEDNKGGSGTTSSDVGSMRRGSGRVATDLMDNINLSSP
jgi:hypothetical protein